MSIPNDLASGHQTAGPRRASTRRDRVRRGAGWLLAALMLCEWRAPTERVLRSEQRSALSAIGLKRCRANAACKAARFGPTGAFSDSVTYLSSALGANGSLRRWPDDGLPITVWLAESGGSPTRSSVRRRIARDAFHTWIDAGVPERFVFVPDSAGAMVHVLWRRQLPDRRAGQVTRQADGDGWLRAAVVELSVRNMAGAIQDTATLRAVALHEVGHLLGLEHSPDERDIMAPWVVARQLSARDRASATLLYEIGLGDEQ